MFRIRATQRFKKIQRKREKMSKDYFDIILKYKNYFESYYPPKQIKSAWYRFYFFIKTNVINYRKYSFNNH